MKKIIDEKGVDYAFKYYSGLLTETKKFNFVFEYSVWHEQTTIYVNVKKL